MSDKKYNGEKNKVNSRYLVFISLIAGMGGYLFGYDWVVIGGAKPFYEVYFSIAHIPWLQGWVMVVPFRVYIGGNHLSLSTSTVGNS